MCMERWGRGGEGVNSSVGMETGTGENRDGKREMEVRELEINNQIATTIIVHSTFGCVKHKYSKPSAN